MSSDAPAQPPLIISEHHPLPVELHPNIDHIVTEDGAPLDNQFSEKQQRLLTEVLYSSWQPGEPFVAMSNVGLFFAVRTPPLVPDVMVSLGVSSPVDPFPKQNRSYFIWEYGKAPDLVVEVVSNKEGGEDSIKLAGYARIGIAYYVVFDPEEHLSAMTLRVYRLSGGRYELDKSESPVFDNLRIGVRVWSGAYEDMDGKWLRWTTPNGDLLPTGKERAIAEAIRAEAEKERADIEKQRAEIEKQRADIEKQCADQAAEEAARLRQKLEQLGINL